VRRSRGPWRAHRDHERVHPAAGPAAPAYGRALLGGDLAAASRRRPSQREGPRQVTVRGMKGGRLLALLVALAATTSRTVRPTDDAARDGHFDSGARRIGRAHEGHGLRVGGGLGAAVRKVHGPGRLRSRDREGLARRPAALRGSVLVSAGQVRDGRERCFRAAQATLGRGLEEAGFEVLVAGDTVEALDHLAQRRCAVVLADYQLPGTNGLDLLAALRGAYPPR